MEALGYFLTSLTAFEGAFLAGCGGTSEYSASKDPGVSAGFRRLNSREIENELLPAIRSRLASKYASVARTCGTNSACAMRLPRGVTLRWLHLPRQAPGSRSIQRLAVLDP